jgi:hypothetical protein
MRQHALDNIRFIRRAMESAGSFTFYDGAENVREGSSAAT